MVYAKFAFEKGKLNLRNNPLPETPFDPRKIKVIVFDIDGTLTETDDYLIQKTAKGLQSYLFWIRPESIRLFAQKSLMIGETIVSFFYAMLDFFGIDFLYVKLHEKLTAAEKEYRFEAVEGLVPVIHYLAQKYSLAILTAGSEKSTQAFINKFELESLFQVVVSSQTYQREKPHPQPLTFIARRLDAPIQECLMVGDTLFDGLCAKRAGAQFIGVKTGFDSEKTLRRFGGATMVIDSIRDLPAILGCA